MTTKTKQSPIALDPIYRTLRAQVEGLTASLTVERAKVVEYAARLTDEMERAHNYKAEREALLRCLVLLTQPR